MLVSITTEDIVKGQPKAPETCAVALAMRRALPYRHILVGSSRICVEGEDYEIPSEVFRFISDFDAGEAVEPLEFNTDDLQSIYDESV